MARQNADPRVMERLLQWRELRDQGKPASADAVCSDCPELIPEVQRAIDNDLHVSDCMHRLFPSDSGITSSAELSSVSSWESDWTAGDQPVEGYTLIEKLGRGYSGEVWKAAAPGNSKVAIKFVPMWVEVDQQSLGQQEQKALVDRLADLNHVNLLKIHRYWAQEDWLVIGMDLADKTVMDCFDEARAQGQAGIPREDSWATWRTPPRPLTTSRSAT